MKKLIALLLTLTPLTTHPTVEYPLTKAARSKIFDRATGTLYLGLAGGAENAITRVSRYAGNGSIATKGIASNAILNDKVIDLLAISTEPCNLTPHLVAIPRSATDDPYTQTKVTVLTNDGKTVNQTENDLNDANEATTAGIVSVAANSTHAFAAVRANGENFGAEHSGIALMTIDRSQTEITVVDATTGAEGNLANTLDIKSDVLYIESVLTGFIDPQNENIKLYWDEKLQRLYIGVNVQANSGGDDGARAIAIAYVDSNGALQIEEVAPAGVFDGDATDIIGIAAADNYAGVLHIGVMHATTGPSYLIVNGRTGAQEDQPFNSIYALPLVDNPSGANHGKLARKNSDLTNGKFTLPVTANAELTLNTDAAAMVGAGPLPLPPENVPADMVVVGDAVYVAIEDKLNPGDPTQMIADPGIFYSQAQFDYQGRIVRWTPWTKRAFPYDGFAKITDAADIGKVRFVEVDAVNGRLWAVDGFVSDPDGDTDPDTDNKHLAVTAWTFGNAANEETKKTLVYQLNAALPRSCTPPSCADTTSRACFARGCFSVLDLDASTRGLGQYSPARYALFGGVNKVVFAKISKSNAQATPFDKSNVTNKPYPQTVIADFSSAQNFLETTLSGGAVTCLEYSRRGENSADQNYFFAGTQKGLFAFANNGAGFTVDDTVDNLNAVPFVNGQWTQLNNIKGTVIELKTSGEGDDADGNGGLYVLTMQAGTFPERPVISRLYRVPYYTTVAQMNNNVKLLAESEVAATNSDLSAVKEILGMEIVAAADDGSREQLIIATNRGLYLSRTGAGNGIINANNQEEAAWGLQENVTMYYNIFGIDNPGFRGGVRSTTWPVEVADEKGLFSFERGIIKQFLTFYELGVGIHLGFSPLHFNASCTHQAFQTLPIINHFWSDGGRRWFIIKRESDTSDRNRFMVLPYDTAEWTVCNPNLYLTDPVLQQVGALYWVRHLGMSGFLMAGTSSGVVSLE